MAIWVKGEKTNWGKLHSSRFNAWQRSASSHLVILISEAISQDAVGNLCYHYMILILLIYFRCSPFLLVPNISNHFTIPQQTISELLGISQNLSQNCSVSETVLEVFYLRTCLRIVLSQNMSQNCSISENVPELSNKLWIMKIRKLSSSLILWCVMWKINIYSIIYLSKIL